MAQPDGDGGDDNNDGGLSGSAQQPLQSTSIVDISDLLKVISDEMDDVNTTQVGFYTGGSSHANNETMVEEEDEEDEIFPMVYINNTNMNSFGDPNRCGVPQKVDGMHVRQRKRNRTTETHNNTERKRREKIKSKLDELQQLVPNSNMMDRASMLEAAIAYMKLLQYQVLVLSGGGGANFHHGSLYPSSHLQQPPIPPPLHPAAANGLLRQAPPVQFPIVAIFPQYLPVGVGMSNTNMPSHVMSSPTASSSLGIGFPPGLPIQTSSAEKPQQVPASVKKKDANEKE